MTSDVEIILDWQQRRINARVLGLAASENPLMPYLERSECPQERDGWLQKAEAWVFGWHIENAARAFPENKALSPKA